MAATSSAMGAMAAQACQAGGSFALQILAAWALGAAGLGTFSLLYGVIIFTTALASGFVGDSLVILKRSDFRIRSGLQFWAIVVATLGFIVGWAISGASGLLTWADAGWFALALSIFMIEELIRRLLMVSLRFWRLVAVDAIAVVTALATIAVLRQFTGLSITSFLIGLCVGQAAGLVVGIALVPAHERILVPFQRNGIREVAAFGAWRGAQVSIPPLVLTVARLVVTAGISAAALGEVEAARILVAPITLAVQGFGSYLLSTYVRDRELGLRVLNRRAWQAAGLMMGTAFGLGGLIIAFAPGLGYLVSGPSFQVDAVVVAGWVCYVLGQASLQPFASLGAVYGQQSRLLFCRLGDAGLALAVLTVLILPLGIPAAVTPYVLGLGLAVGGFAVRGFVIRPLLPPTGQVGKGSDQNARSGSALSSGDEYLANKGVARPVKFAGGGTRYLIRSN